METLKLLWRFVLSEPIVQGLGMFGFYVALDARVLPTAKLAVLLFLWFPLSSLVTAVCLTWRNNRLLARYCACAYEGSYYDEKIRMLHSQFWCTLLVHLACYPFGAFFFADSYKGAGVTASVFPWVQEKFIVAMILLAIGAWFQDFCYPEDEL